MMIGHERQERCFAEGFASGHMAHAWLLAGPRGVGKASFARRAACWLIAGEHGSAEDSRTLDLREPNVAAARVREGTHPEFLWIKREVPEDKRSKDGGDPNSNDIARSINIAQIRALLARLRLRPVASTWRCVVIDSIDDVERGAVNALLKTLEEPPEYTVFLLVSHNPARLLPTIRSRCRILRFAPLDERAMDEYLEGIELPSGDEVRQVLSRLAGGSPGRIAQFSGEDTVSMHRMLSEIAKQGDSDNALRIALSKAIAGKGAAPRIESMLSMARQIAADMALSRSGSAMLRAIDAEAQLGEIERSAISQSEDPATVAFSVGSVLSRISAG